MYFQIQQGKLAPSGNINETTIAWKNTTPQTFNNVLTVDSKTKVHIRDKVEDQASSALTQIRFATKNNELYVEMGFRKFNYTSGLLLGDYKTISTWEANPRYISDLT